MSKLKLSTVERVAIWEAHRRKCVYTGEPVSYSELPRSTVHVKPDVIRSQPPPTIYPVRYRHVLSLLAALLVISLTAAPATAQQDTERQHLTPDDYAQW